MTSCRELYRKKLENNVRMCYTYDKNSRVDDKLVAGTIVSTAYAFFTEKVKLSNDKTLKETVKDSKRQLADFITWWN